MTTPEPLARMEVHCAKVTAMNEARQALIDAAKALKRLQEAHVLYSNYREWILWKIECGDATARLFDAIEVLEKLEAT